VGAPGSVRDFNGRHGGFGSMLACVAVSCGVVTSVQACWRGQRRGREKGRVWLFLLPYSGSHGWVLGREDGASTIERSRRELGHCGEDRESSGGGWLLALILACTFADFCPPSVC
jgi:hypothetical protein